MTTNTSPLPQLHQTRGFQPVTPWLVHLWAPIHWRRHPQLDQPVCDISLRGLVGPLVAISDLITQILRTRMKAGPGIEGSQGVPRSFGHGWKETRLDLGQGCHSPILQRNGSVTGIG